MSLVDRPRQLAFNPNITPAEKARLQVLLPEVQWIGDANLREVVLQIFAHAWRAGAWKDPADCHTLTRDGVGANTPRWNFIGHTRAVTQESRNVVRALAEFGELSFDMDLVVAAALLHDVGKLVEFEPGPQSAIRSAIGHTVHHGTVGAQWALEAGLAPAVAHAIFTHTPATTWNPATPESLIVQMVDLTLASVTKMANEQEGNGRKRT